MSSRGRGGPASVGEEGNVSWRQEHKSNKVKNLTPPIVRDGRVHAKRATSRTGEASPVRMPKKPSERECQCREREQSARPKRCLLERTKAEVSMVLSVRPLYADPCTQSHGERSEDAKRTHDRNCECRGGAGLHTRARHKERNVRRGGRTQENHERERGRRVRDQVAESPAWVKHGCVRRHRKEHEQCIGQDPPFGLGHGGGSPPLSEGQRKEGAY